MPAKMISLGSTSDALFKPHLTIIDVLCVFFNEKILWGSSQGTPLLSVSRVHQLLPERDRDLRAALFISIDWSI